jgi:hypothetical protein
VREGLGTTDLRICESDLTFSALLACACVQNSELLSMTYGAMVTQLIKDYKVGELRLRAHRIRCSRRRDG